MMSVERWKISQALIWVLSDYLPDELLEQWLKIAVKRAHEDTGWHAVSETLLVMKKGRESRKRFGFTKCNL